MTEITFGEAEGALLEMGGEAFYRALRIFGGANDYGHSETRTFIVTTFKTVAVGIALENGSLSADQITKIDSMFYLDLGGLDTIVQQITADPAMVDKAIADLVTLATQAASSRIGAEPVIEAADNLFAGALVETTSGTAGADRAAAVLAMLHAAAPDAVITPPPPSAPADNASSQHDQPAATLTPVDCPARLHDGETCYAVSTATLYQQHNVVSHVRYGGFSGRVRIARGISFRAGDYAVGADRAARLQQVAEGTLCITDQRLVFLSDLKNLDLPLARLLSCDTSIGMIEVSRANAASLLFDGLSSEAVEVFEQVTGTSPADRQALEQQQADEYATSLARENEPTSNTWRNVLLILALVAVALLIRWAVVR